MDPVLAALISEGEAIYSDSDAAGRAGTSTAIHIDQVMDWLDRSTNYVSNTEPRLIGQLLNCRPTDSFQAVFDAIFRMLTVLRSVATSVGPATPTPASKVELELEGEPPDFVKWVMWVRRNFRKHPAWTIFTILVVLIIGVIELEPHVTSLLGHKDATHAIESLGQSFTKAANGDLDPVADTCLDGPTQIVPAKTEVCANMHGSWRDGRGPLGVCRKGAMSIWTRQAHAPYAELSSKQKYQHNDRFREVVDYVVCVSPPENAERTINKSDRMGIDVWPKPWPPSLGSCAPIEEVPCPEPQ
jgi:hypothetical protein